MTDRQQRYQRRCLNVQAARKAWNEHILRAVVLSVGVMLTGATVDVGLAQEKGESEKAAEESLAAQRFDVMKDHIAGIVIESQVADFPKRFSEKPIFRYTDPARGYVGATVWKLGDTGRPHALLAVELNPATFGKPCIAYEYGTVTDTPFTAKWPKAKWSPQGTLYRFQPIPDAPAPEKTGPLRLIQMRALARRFTGTEVVKTEKCELRLLPQPVDRYTPAKRDKADGAIFFLTFGTNPEVVLLIESDGEQWNFAAGRLTGAQEVTVRFDDVIVWQGDPLQGGAASPFTGHLEPIMIPGIGADGKEIRE